MDCGAPGMFGIAQIDERKLSVGLNQERKTRDRVPQHRPAQKIEKRDFQNDPGPLEKKKPRQT